MKKWECFFDSRLDGYEERQLTCIEGARSFYPFTASCLHLKPHANVLDLGYRFSSAFEPGYMRKEL